MTGRENAEEVTQLRALAQQLQLAICDIDELKTCQPSRFILSFIESKPTNEADGATPNLPQKILALSSTQDEFKGNIFIDFVHGKLGHRREFGGGRGQPIAKAIGLKGGANPSVVDATAGLGRDAFVLANLGAQVTMIERSPILAALLKDGLQRLTAESELSGIAQHLHLVHANAIEWLRQQTSEETDKRPEVVYLDPMYPHRTKSALVKKEMRALRALVGDDDDAALLLQAARQCATKRVVVKRPKGAPLVSNEKPSGNVQSKNTRYDIYSITQ